jgi:hypothetical protein
MHKPLRHYCLSKEHQPMTPWVHLTLRVEDDWAVDSVGPRMVFY